VFCASRARSFLWSRAGYVLVEPAATRQVVAGPEGLSYAVVGAVV
jgi:hypothetical protein